MEIIFKTKQKESKMLRKLSCVHFLLLQIYNFCFLLSVLEYAVLFFPFSTFSPIYLLSILQILFNFCKLWLFLFCGLVGPLLCLPMRLETWHFLPNMLGSNRGEVALCSNPLALMTVKFYSSSLPSSLSPSVSLIPSFILTAFLHHFPLLAP